MCSFKPYKINCGLEYIVLNVLNRNQTDINVKVFHEMKVEEHYSNKNRLLYEYTVQESIRLK